MLPSVGRRAADSRSAALFTPGQRGSWPLSPVCPRCFRGCGLVRSVKAGQAVELNVLHWDGPLALVLHVDALSVLFALMGTGLGAFVLLYSIGYMAHDKAATRFYCLHADLHRRLCRTGLQRQPLCFLSLLGTGGLCSFSLVGFWYTNREAVAGARKVLLMTHIAGYGLLAAILVVYPPHRQRSVDRSQRGAQPLPAASLC